MYISDAAATLKSVAPGTKKPGAGEQTVSLWLVDDPLYLPINIGNDAEEKVLLSGLPGDTKGTRRGLWTALSPQVIIRLLLCPALNSQSSLRANYSGVWQITEIIKCGLGSYSAWWLCLFWASVAWSLNSNDNWPTATSRTNQNESLIGRLKWRSSSSSR